MLRVMHEVKEQEDHFTLTGPMDERAAKVLNPLLSQIGRKVVINFSGVEYFNSLGIRTWINFLRILLDGRQVSYEECTIDLMQQINMMPVLSKGVEIKSFIAEFVCDNCGQEQKKLMNVKAGRELLLSQLEGQICPSCQKVLRFEEDPQTILFFLAS